MPKSIQAMWNIQKLNRATKMEHSCCHGLLWSLLCLCVSFLFFSQLKCHWMNNLSCPIIWNNMMWKLKWRCMQSLQYTDLLPCYPLVPLLISKKYLASIWEDAYAFNVSIVSLVYLIVYTNIKAHRLVSKAACWLMFARCDNNVSDINNIWQQNGFCETEGERYYCL